MRADKVSGTKTSRRKQTESALEKLSEELAAVTDDDLVHINIDLVATVATAYGIVPKLKAFHEAIAKLPNFNPDMVEGFEKYAVALYEAHVDYVSAIQPAEALPDLSAKGTALRDRLYPDVTALVARGFINEARIREVRTETGYKALALDLSVLGEAVQDAWSEVEGKTAIQLEEVLQAQTMAQQILHALGAKEQAPAAVAEAAAKRARAFTLFRRAYSQVRRAITFLRWDEGDADVIAPSIYQARADKRKKPEPETPVPPTTGTPALPGAEPPPAPVAPSAPPSASVGSPHSDPFTSPQ